MSSRGIVLILGLVLLGWSVMQAAGGWSVAIAGIDPQKLRWIGHDDGLLAAIEKWAIPVFGSVLAQELIARTLAARSAATARRAAIMGGTMYLAAGLVPVFIGLVGVSLLPGLDEPEQIIPRLAQMQLAGFAYIVFAGALISAILSTVDSALLSAASLLSHNVIARLVPGGMDDRARLSATVAGLLTGMLVWILGAFVLGMSAPYLTSMAAAVVAYLEVAIWCRA